MNKDKKNSEHFGKWRFNNDEHLHEREVKFWEVAISSPDTNALQPSPNQAIGVEHTDFHIPNQVIKGGGDDLAVVAREAQWCDALCVGVFETTEALASRQLPDLAKRKNMDPKAKECRS